MARPQVFERELRVASADLGQDAIATLLAKTAREALAAAQGAGEFPSGYTRFVNGREGAQEQTVVPPGPIVYVASWWPEIISYGLAFAEQRSPVRSGRYKASWFVMVNGSQFIGDLDAVPLDAEVIITNDQPYSRKIEIGAERVAVPPGIVEDTVSALRRRFGNIIAARRRFINLEGAYHLRGSSGRARRRQGHAVTYPAAVVTMSSG
jgi:hypothetical protein